MTTLGDLAATRRKWAQETANGYVENLLGDVIRCSPLLNSIAEIEAELSRIKSECSIICQEDYYSHKNNTLPYLIEEHRKHFAAIQTLIEAKK